MTWETGKTKLNGSTYKAASRHKKKSDAKKAADRIREKAWATIRKEGEYYVVYKKA